MSEFNKEELEYIEQVVEYYDNKHEFTFKERVVLDRVLGKLKEKLK